MGRVYNDKSNDNNHGIGRGEEWDYIEYKFVMRHFICGKKQAVYFTWFERYSGFCPIGAKLGSTLIPPLSSRDSNAPSYVLF